MVKQRGYNWPEHFTIGVLQASGGVAQRWASLLAEDAGMKVHLAYAPDLPTKLRWLHYRVVDITDGGQHEISRVLEGVWRYCDRDTGAFPVRVVWMRSKYDSGFIVRGDSYIKDVYDIKPGVRVVDMRSYLPSQTNVEGLLAWAGIYDLEKDVKWVPANSTEEKIKLIVDGKADVAFAIPSAPSSYEAEKNRYGIRWIDLNPEKDPEGASRLYRKYITSFSPMFRGVPSAIGHWSTVGTDQFCCQADADTDFVYHLSKWLDENWKRYKDSHSWLEHMTLKNLMEDLDIICLPCHEGLIKYLKELGLWTDAHQKRQKQNVGLINRYCEASQKAMWLADEKGIAVTSDNPEWVHLWENYKKEQGLPIFDFLPSLGKGRLS